MTDSVANLTTDYTWDGNGFMTGETETRAGQPSQTTTYRPNLQDRLATLTTPTGPPVHYSYDIDGLRVEKRSTLEATRYGYDGTNLRRETNVTNNPLATYDWANGRILRTKRNTQTSYAQHDALKSPIRWSLASGAEQGRATYTAWGETATSAGTLPPIGFGGYYADQESQSYYAQQRYYSPGLGRFNRVDPGPLIALQPITINRYLYANGNPLVYVDSDGRIAFLAEGADQLGRFREWLGERAGTYSQGIAGQIAAATGGVARGFVGASEGALRGVNYVANVGSVVLADYGLNNQEWAAEHFKETQGTHAAAAGAYDFVANQGGAGLLYDQAVDTTSRVYEGDVQAIGDFSEFATGFASGSGVAKTTAQQAANASLRTAQQVESLALAATQQAKNALNGVRRVVEGSDGTPLVTLEKRLDMLAENDFGGGAIEHPVLAPIRRSDFQGPWRDLPSDNFSWKNYLEMQTGTKAPVGMPDPHAHHVLAKRGRPGQQRQLVQEGQEILRNRAGIDPIWDVSNLVWAPNRVPGQHSTDSIRKVVDRLRELDKANAEPGDFSDALRGLGETAADRR
ncbi:MAG: RHS repeat-associated core domain-containing protein [Pseudomarimonas sp.]